jgi:hypothetical protein
MQHYLNERLVKRNRRYSRWMMYGGLGASIAAVIITFTQPALVIYAFALIVVGGLVSQVGTAIHNRFGRSPRIDEVIDYSLKGLDDQHAIFHYLLGTNHALFTPSGTYAVVPMLEQGRIEYAQGVWKHEPPPRRISLGRSRVRTLKNVEKEAKREAQQLQRYLRKNIPQHIDIGVDPLILFLAKDTYVEAEQAPFIAVHRKKLKSALRKIERRRPFTPEDIQQLASYLKLN